jgi:hypothetical protein
MYISLITYIANMFFMRSDKLSSNGVVSGSMIPAIKTPMVLYSDADA